MQSHRDADPGDPANIAHVRPKVGGAQAEEGIAMHRIDEAQHARDCLRKDRGDGRSGNTRAKHQHEQEIQSNVQHGAYDQKQQRRFAVAKRLQHGSGVVVYDLSSAAADVDPQIEHGLRQDVLRRLHQPQERLHAEAASDAEHERAEACIIERACKRRRNVAL